MKTSPLSATRQVCNTRAPWLALQFFGPVNVTRVNISSETAAGTKNLEVRLTDELPTSGDQMFTGGQLLGTFEGPATEEGQIIKVEGPARIGRYVLVQMNNQDCLNLKQVEAFGHGW